MGWKNWYRKSEPKAIDSQFEVDSELAALRDSRYIHVLEYHLGPEDVLARYIKGLRHPDPAIRLAAAEVLGETAATAAAALPVAALADYDMSVVSQANESLVQLGQAAVPALNEATKSQNATVRDSATWCLQKITRRPTR